MQKSDDVDLISQIAQGDEHSFLELYDRYASHVYALTLRILGNTMLAEESTQDTFFKLWSRARQYRTERGSLVVWLLTIARRTALDRLRLEARRPVLSDDTDPDDAFLNIPDANTLSDEDRWRSIHFSVQSLPQDQRQVIELAYYYGLSQSEIAETLNWPLGTVKTRLRAGVEHLRRLWQEK